MDIVQGYLFRSVAEEGDLVRRNDTVCRILRRAEVTDVSEHDVLDMGPAFVVRFWDGLELVAHANELSPWYPTD